MNANTTTKHQGIQQSTFAAGCFWGIESAFAKLSGVKSTAVGYSGGHKLNPTYAEVCRGDTGHAEAVQLSFDPNIISYEMLLATFWQIHDPTQINRQGPDIGSQYRSVIFYHSPEQQQLASAAKQQQEKKINRSIATEIVPIRDFWQAEEYHQQYFDKRQRLQRQL